MTDRFDDLIATCPDGDFRKTAIEVVDTAFLAKVWLECRGYEPTPAEVLDLTKMIMKHHAYRQDQVADDDFWGG